MAPKGEGGEPSAALSAAIDKTFGSMDGLKEKWAAASAPAARFGSGWVWLIVDGKDLKITSTANQDNPLMDGVEGGTGIPILGIDVWEYHSVSSRQTNSHCLLLVQARVLSQIPKPPARICRRVVGRGQLEAGQLLVRRCSRRQGSPVLIGLVALPVAFRT